ncbi:MAG: branched-chain amino acid ABC transporter permease [Chloroflexi bacterium]|jgi:branched-chain amino acid transport system permease protein|nr:branched-chain amino acid ABC transporter permease [Chloroflexota bacterium]
MESGVFHSTYKEDMKLRPTPFMRLRLVVVLVAVVVFPFFANNYQLTLANQVGIAAIGAIGLNILTGFTGQISLGQGAFMAVGAYGSGLLVTRLGMPWWLTIPVAALIAAAVGAFFGLPSLRLKGLYLAIATLAAQQIISWAIIRSPLTGGVEALVVPSPTLFGVRINSDPNFYWIILFFLILTIFFAVNLFRTKIGRAFIAIRDQDIAAEVMGVNIFRYKVTAFAISSFIAGMSGALLAQYRGIVNYERFTIETSITFLAMIIVGGLGSVSGSIYGAILITLLPAILSNLGSALGASIPQMATLIPFIQKGAFGIIIILFLIFEPEGLAKIWRDIKDYFRLWPFSY